MKKILSTGYADWAFNSMMFLTRLCFGGLILANHGFEKLVKFSSLRNTFPDPFHIGSKWALLLVVFAEVFCALLVIAGLFTRLAAIPLVITMGIAFFMTHHYAINKGELAAVYLTGFTAILLCGPGKASIDHLMGK